MCHSSLVYLQAGRGIVSSSFLLGVTIHGLLRDRHISVVGSFQIHELFVASSRTWWISSYSLVRSIWRMGSSINERDSSNTNVYCGPCNIPFVKSADQWNPVILLFLPCFENQVILIFSFFSHNGRSPGKRTRGECSFAFHFHLGKKVLEHPEPDLARSPSYELACVTLGIHTLGPRSLTFKFSITSRDNRTIFLGFLMEYFPAQWMVVVDDVSQANFTTLAHCMLSLH